MRKILALFLVLTVLLMLAACSSVPEPAASSDKPSDQTETNEHIAKPDEPDSEKETEKPEKEEPEKPEQPEQPEEPAADPEPSQGLDAYDNAHDHPHEGKDLTVFDGIYRSKLPQGEDEETWLEVTGFNDFILLEYAGTMEGSVYRYWAEEFWPGEGWYTDTDRNSVSGKSQCFSSMAQYDSYSDLPRNRCITLTEDGIVLNYDDSDAEYFARDDGFEGAHTAPEAMRQWFGADVLSDQDGSQQLLGTWGFWTDWDFACIQFRDDGTFTLIRKIPAMPIHVFRGVYGFSSDTGNLVLAAEQIGHGQYPYLTEWEWYVDVYGYLCVADCSNTFLEDTYSFWAIEEEFFAALKPDIALGYVTEAFYEEGMYTDLDNIEYSYYYSLPQFCGYEHDHLLQINQQIMDLYDPIIEMEQQAMAEGSFISFDHVNWQAAVYHDILFLHVYAYSYDWEEHTAFYIDVNTLEELDAPEVLQRLELDERTFLSSVRNDVENIFLDMFSDVPEKDWAAYGLDDCLEQTLSPEYLHVQLPIFVDHDGTITVYAMIVHPAGSGLMWVPICPFGYGGETEAVG